jgi:phage RecT family recombinase
MPEKTTAKDGALLVRDSKTISALQRQLYALLANDTIVRKFLAEAFFVIKSSDKLMHSTMHSLLCSIFEAASVGLSLSSAASQAYLVPFQNNKRAGKPLEAKLIIGYRGYETLAQRESRIKIFSTCVFRKDVFEYQLGSHPEIRHKPYIPSLEQPENRVISDEFTGAYAIFTYPDGYQFPLFHDRQEIDKRRARSKAGEDGPWVTDYYAMALKCPIREGASKFIAHDFAPRLVEMATRDDLRSLNMPVGPAMLETGKTTEEAASEITGESTGTESAGDAGAGTGPPESGPGEEQGRVKTMSQQSRTPEIDTNKKTGSTKTDTKPGTGGFEFVEGKLVSAVNRGKYKVISVQTQSGSNFQLSTFDGEHLRRAQELVNSEVRIAYTSVVKEGRTYYNMARGAAIEAL